MTDDTSTTETAERTPPPGDDIIAELSAKYGCDFDRNPIEYVFFPVATPVTLRAIHHHAHSALPYHLISLCRGGGVDHPSTDPIQWYGSMVSPSLRQSQQDFTAGTFALQLHMAIKLDAVTAVYGYISNTPMTYYTRAALALIAELASKKQRILDEIVSYNISKSNT